jgi:L,D-peptidoglycan transpeptidase YkuD (ErfK/YbiS/YcfS/YnhG family)
VNPVLRNSTVPRSAWLLAMCIAVAGCAHQPAAPGETSRWSQARQMVLVTSAGWDADRGMLRRFERDGGGWRAVGEPQPVTLGRAGSAWGLGLHDARDDGPVKREGDGRSPAGVFAIGEAFGYAATAATALPYTAMQASDYCVDVSGSPLYNRIVDADVVGRDAVKGATEPMRRDLHADGDQRYRLGFVIEHNPRQVAMGGSCIFAHLWKSPTDPTTGCTAMDPATMGALVGWLRPDENPVFVLLPMQAYTKLQAQWALPRIDAL